MDNYKSIENKDNYLDNFPLKEIPHLKLSDVTPELKESLGEDICDKIDQTAANLKAALEKANKIIAQFDVAHEPIIIKTSIKIGDVIIYWGKLDNKWCLFVIDQGSRMKVSDCGAATRLFVAKNLNHIHEKIMDNVKSFTSWFMNSEVDPKSD